MRASASVYLRCVLWVGVLCLGLACRSQEVVPATEILVEVDSDLTVRDQLTRIEVQVSNADSGQVSDSRSLALVGPQEPTKLGQYALPVTFGVHQDRETRFQLRVVGYGPRLAGGAVEVGQVVSRTVVASFTPNRTMRLRVFLDAQCVDQCMGDSKTTCSVSTKTEGQSAAAVICESIPDVSSQLVVSEHHPSGSGGAMASGGRPALTGGIGIGPTGGLLGGGGAMGPSGGIVASGGLASGGTLGTGGQRADPAFEACFNGNAEVLSNTCAECACGQDAVAVSACDANCRRAIHCANHCNEVAGCDLLACLALIDDGELAVAAEAALSVACGGRCDLAPYCSASARPGTARTCSACLCAGRPDVVGSCTGPCRQLEECVRTACAGGEWNDDCIFARCSEWQPDTYLVPLWNRWLAMGESCPVDCASEAIPGL